MVRPFWFLAFITTATIWSNSSAQTARVETIESRVAIEMAVLGEPEKTASLEERMKELDVPAVSIAVIEGGRLQWAGAYGYADREAEVPATTETLFQATAISAAVSAMGALRLVESGRLSLDEAITDALRSWRLSENQFTESANVTLRSLLNGTSALTPAALGAGERGTTVPSITEILDGIGDAPPVHVSAEPGTVYSPTGSGYAVAQVLMTDVTGMEFAELMADLVLQPLEMLSSTYDQDLSEDWAARAAFGYDSQGERVPGGWHTQPAAAFVGLWTTPTDLAKYIIEVQNAYAGDGRVLSQEMARAMLQPGLAWRGMGPAIEVGGQQFGLGGSNFGFNTLFTASIEEGFGAVVFTNSNNGPQLAHELIRTIGYAWDWPGIWQRKSRVALDDSQLEPFVGRYQTINEILEIKVEGGRLYWGQSELIPESEHRFFDPSCCTFEFKFEDGVVVGFDIIEVGFSATRIE